MADGFVQVDVRRVVSGLGRMSKAAKDLSKPFREFRPLLRQDLTQHYSTHTQPVGLWPPWAPSYLAKIMAKPRTVLKRVRSPRRPLYMPGGFTVRGARRVQAMLGRLDGLNEWSISRVMLQVLSIVPWAGIHQWGGIAGRGARIPQRMYLWISERRMEELAVILQRHVLLAWWT
jgi:phage gpG-like protein